jgi:uncharacterized protein with PQ loop repeat
LEVNGVIATWRDALHQVLDLYERKRGAILVFFPLLFLFFIVLNIACYWWAIYTAFPYYMQTHEASHYVKLQLPVGILGALFDSLSFFITIWIIRRALASTKTSEYVFHLSLDFVVAILATLWVLFVFTFGGWIISLWESAPEQLGERGSKYTNRAVQALQDPTGRENAKNIYFGLIMGVSAALPTCLHLCLFFLSLFRKWKSALFPKKDPSSTPQDPKGPN